MKGHVPTPPAVVELMVGKLFEGRRVTRTVSVLDPGCGEGAFIAGMLEYCRSHGVPVPQITGVELNPRLVEEARGRLGEVDRVRVGLGNFLSDAFPRFDYVIGNPPYVPITGLSEQERTEYRATFTTAVERFDLYFLFLERSVGLLRDGGRLCMIIPEKFEYVHSAAPLRRILGRCSIEEIDHLPEDTFPDLVTYPTILTLVKRPSNSRRKTLVKMRDGTSVRAKLPTDGLPWSSSIAGVELPYPGGSTLSDISIRVSCGIATGADSLYVHDAAALPPSLQQLAHPTVSGRQLGLHGPNEVRASAVMLVPYDGSGKLLPESRLGDFLTFVSRPDNKRRLQSRTCSKRGGDRWYRFHDNAPLSEILRPKILCKDIAPEPHFWADTTGKILPRHSIYYIVPKPGINLDRLLAYLNGGTAAEWLKANTQRAANGFYRLQSSALKRLPVPPDLSRSVTLDNWSR